MRSCFLTSSQTRSYATQTVSMRSATLSFFLSFDFVTSNQITGEFIACPWSGCCVLCAARQRYGRLCNKRFYNHWRSTNEHFPVAGGDVAFAGIHITLSMHHLSCILGATKEENHVWGCFLLPFPPLCCTFAQRRPPLVLFYSTRRVMDREGTGYPGCSFLCSLIWTSQFDLILVLLFRITTYPPNWNQIFCRMI